MLGNAAAKKAADLLIITRQRRPAPRWDCGRIIAGHTHMTHASHESSHSREEGEGLECPGEGWKEARKAGSRPVSCSAEAAAVQAGTLHRVLLPDTFMSTLQETTIATLSMR